MKKQVFGLQGDKGVRIDGRLVSLTMKKWPNRMDRNGEGGWPTFVISGVMIKEHAGRVRYGVSMGLTYFKRYRMELDLSQPLFKAPALVSGYFLEPWNESLIEAHAEAKFQSFCFELDANLFPCLGDRDGCRRLMQEIASREGFTREATWLLTYQSGSKRGRECCGTVQGVSDSNGYGAIQNLGITPSHRGQGLGSILMHAALSGFQRVGLRRAFLEVTAQNCGAVVLYQRLGFCQTKTVYKAADVAYA